MLIKLCPVCNKKVMLKHKSCDCGHVLSDMIIVSSDSQMTGVTPRYRKTRSGSKSSSAATTDKVNIHVLKSNQRTATKKPRHSQSHKQLTAKVDKNRNVLHTKSRSNSLINSPSKKHKKEPYFEPYWFKQNNQYLDDIAMATALKEINAKIAVQSKIWSIVDSS